MQRESNELSLFSFESAGALRYCGRLFFPTKQLMLDRDERRIYPA